MRPYKRGKMIARSIIKMIEEGGGGSAEIAKVAVVLPATIFDDLLRDWGAEADDDAGRLRIQGSHSSASRSAERLGKPGVPRSCRQPATAPKRRGAIRRSRAARAYTPAVRTFFEREYRTGITERQLQGAPRYGNDNEWSWEDQTRTRAVNDYYGVVPI